MATNDLSLIDASKPDGATEFVSSLDNYQRELRTAVKAWAAVEHDLKGRHKFSIGTTASRPATSGDTPAATGTQYFNTDLGYLEYYNGTTWKPGFLYDRNFLWNAGFDRYGSATLPVGWTLAGAGASTAKNTTAGQFVFGTSSVTLTRAGTDCNLTQAVWTLFPEISGASFWGSRVVTVGCWVYCATASIARIGVNDGTTVTYSDYHTGNSTLQFLSKTVTLGATPTVVSVLLQVDTTNGSASFDGAVLALGANIVSVPPVLNSQESYERVFGTGATPTGGGSTTVFVGTGFQDTTEGNVTVRVSRPFVARRMYARCSTAPTAGDTYVFTLRKNSSDTIVTCTISDANTTAEDTTNELSFAAGDTICVKVVASGGTPASHYMIAIECVPIPG